MADSQCSISTFLKLNNLIVFLNIHEQNFPIYIQNLIFLYMLHMYHISYRNVEDAGRHAIKLCHAVTQGLEIN